MPTLNNDNISKESLLILLKKLDFEVVEVIEKTSFVIAFGNQTNRGLSNAISQLLKEAYSYDQDEVVNVEFAFWNKTIRVKFNTN